MNIHVRQLSTLEQLPLERHFLALGREDRRLRFGTGMNDFAVRTYVKRIDFENDAVFGVLDDELRLVGAAYLGRARAFHALPYRERHERRIARALKPGTASRALEK